MDKVGDQLYLNLTLSSPDRKAYKIPIQYLTCFYVVEGLNKLGATASMVYKETVKEFSELYPLVGNERLTVEIGKTPDEVRRFDFEIFSYWTESVSNVDSRSGEITINWVDSRWNQFHNYPPVRSYEKASISDVMGNLMKGEKIVIEPTKGSTQIVLPQMTVGECISFLRGRAISTDDSSYVFFKDKETFYFVSRNKLWHGKPVTRYTFGKDMHNLKDEVADWSNFGRTESLVRGYSYEKGEYQQKQTKPEDRKGKVFGARDVLDHTSYTRRPKEIYVASRDMDQLKALADIANEKSLEQSMKAMMVGEGRPLVGPGSIIEVMVDSYNEDTAKRNEVNSGKWLVDTVVHFCSPTRYYSKYALTKNAVEISRRSSTGRAGIMA